MQPVIRFFVMLLPGIAVSVVLLCTVPSQAGLSWTSRSGTHLYGWNLICFWSALLLTVLLSFYAGLHKG